MNNEQALKFVDPSDTSSSGRIADAAVDLLRMLCYGVTSGEIRVLRDGATRKDFTAKIHAAAKALRLDFHTDDLLTVDEKMYDEIGNVLGKLFTEGVAVGEPMGLNNP